MIDVHELLEASETRESLEMVVSRTNYLSEGDKRFCVVVEVQVGEF